MKSDCKHRHVKIRCHNDTTTRLRFGIKCFCDFYVETGEQLVKRLNVFELHPHLRPAYAYNCLQ